jgi:hypothetical protein
VNTFLTFDSPHIFQVYMVHQTNMKLPRYSDARHNDKVYFFTSENIIKSHN